MKKLNLILGATAAIVPATILPLICAQTNNNKVETKNENNVKSAVVNSTMVDSDGWVTIDWQRGVKYHISFNDSGEEKTCSIDRIQANNGDEVVKLYPQDTYTKHNESVEYKLTKIDTAKRCTGDGKIFLDLSKATNLRDICNDAFNYTNNSKVKITWVNFVGAIKLWTIGERAFKGQFFDRDDPNKVFDMCGTQIFDIGKEAFRGCCDPNSKYQNVWSIVFSESIMKIGPQAFDSLNGKANNLIADKIIFTGLGCDITTLCQDKNSWPKLTEKGSTEKSVMTRADVLDIYRDTIYKGGGSSTLGKAIVKDNFYASNIRFVKERENWMGFAKQGEGGVDNVRQWYPTVVESGEKATNTKAWTVGAPDNKIWLEPTSDNEYIVRWDPTLPAGLYRYNIVATQGEDENFSLAVSQPIYLNIIEAELEDGSEIVRASYLAGKDTNTWAVKLSGYKKSGIWGVGTNVVSDNKQIEDTFELKPQQEGWYHYNLTWKDNQIEKGTYHIKLVATVQLANNYEITVTKDVILIISDTYYGMQIFDPDAKLLETKTICVDQASEDQTYDITLNMYEGVTTSPHQEELSDPKLSIPDSLKNCISLVKTDTDGVYNIHIKFKQSGTQLLSLGTYQIYAYSTSKSTVLGKDVDYPVYSNVFTIQVISTNGANAYNCEGGSTSLNAKNRTSGEDVNTWSVTNDDVKIDNLQINSNEWSTISAQRMEYIYAELDESTNKSFKIKWDQEFTLTDNWYEIVDMSIEFNLVSTTNDPIHMVLPLSISISNSGDIQPSGGSTILAYSGSTYEIPKPWKMYCNSSSTAVSTEVDYWIDEDLTDPEAIGHVSMRADTQNIGQAYLSYNNLPSGTYDVYVKAYDHENVTVAQQKVTIYVGNLLEITNAPESITFQRGNGKYKTPLKVIYNGEVYKGKVTFTVDYVTSGTMFVDSNNYLNWTSDLKEGQYAPTITAHITTSDTVYSIPVEVEVIVEAAPTPETSNAGVIAGATVGSVVGAGSIGANIGLGVKLHQSSKVKPTKSKKSKK